MKNTKGQNHGKAETAQALSKTDEDSDVHFVKAIKTRGVNGFRNFVPKSVTKEVERPVSKKEMDEVLQEWAAERIIGRRASKCIPDVIDGEVIVMSRDDYHNYSIAVGFADFGDFDLESKNGENYIQGMRVVIDNSFEYPVVYVKGMVPKKYWVKSKKV